MTAEQPYDTSGDKWADLRESILPMCTRPCHHHECRRSRQMTDLLAEADRLRADLARKDETIRELEAALVEMNEEGAGWKPVAEQAERERDEARGESPSGFWSQREWEDWSNELAGLIPEGDESRYSNPEGAQESIIEDCLRAYQATAEQAERQVRDIRQGIEALLSTASRPTLHSATAQINAAALDRLRAALSGVSGPGDPECRNPEYHAEHQAWSERRPSDKESD